MTDDEIRQLIRGAIARHLGGSPVDAAAEVPGVHRTPVVPIAFSRYLLPRAPDEGMCLIEPAVKCNHCGYCECHGH